MSWRLPRPETLRSIAQELRRQAEALDAEAAKLEEVDRWAEAWNRRFEGLDTAALSRSGMGPRRQVKP